MRRFMEDVDIQRRILLSLFKRESLNLDKTLKNSTPGKDAWIWHNEGLQIDAIKFERKQIHFLNDVFTAVVFVVVIA